LQEVEAPTYSDIRLTDGQPHAPASFYSQDDSWYPFPLEAESTPRPIVWLEGLGKLKKSTSSGTQTSDLLACSISPQPTMLRRAPQVPGCSTTN
jgi:hypothetical protein